jgi:multisubunit Na+/H+ antiporter MnhB subunit
MYCLCLQDNFFKNLKIIHYKPVGLGSNFFLGDYLRDDLGKNISFKNNYYGEYTFHYWFWKNMLNKLNIQYENYTLRASVY